MNKSLDAIFDTRQVLIGSNYQSRENSRGYPIGESEFCSNFAFLNNQADLFLFVPSIMDLKEKL